MFTWENNFGGEDFSTATDFKVDEEGLTLLKKSETTTTGSYTLDRVGFLPKGSFSNFQLDFDAPDLAGAWEEGFQAGRHISESNKNPYKESK